MKTTTLTYKQILQLNRILFTETIALRKVFIDLTEDLIAGLLLSQIFYWHGENTEGKTRISYQRDGKTWLVKQRGEWWEEIRITEKQYDRASKILQERGLIEVKVWRSPFYDGNKAIHLRLTDNFYISISDLLLNSPKVNLEEPKFPKGQDGNSPKVNILSETTTETTKKDVSSQEQDPEPEDPPVDLDDFFNRTNEEDLPEDSPVNVNEKQELTKGDPRRTMKLIQNGTRRAENASLLRLQEDSLLARAMRVFCRVRGIPLDAMPQKKYDQWGDALVAMIKKTELGLSDDIAIQALESLLDPDGEFHFEVGNAWKTPYSDNMAEKYFLVALNLQSSGGKQRVTLTSGKGKETIKFSGESNYS